MKKHTLVLISLVSLISSKIAFAEVSQLSNTNTSTSSGFAHVGQIYNCKENPSLGCSDIQEPLTLSCPNNYTWWYNATNGLPAWVCLPTNSSQFPGAN